MLVSSPQEIDSLARRITVGDTISPAKIRETLAKEHKVDATCPVSTGIFLRIVCEAPLSVMEFLLGDHPTIPTEQGISLEHMPVYL